MSMSKSELIEHVAQRCEITKKLSGEVVGATLDIIAESLEAGEKVQLVGFGTFEVRERQARVGVKPGTTEKIQIPASRYPAFKASKNLRESV